LIVDDEKLQDLLIKANMIIMKNLHLEGTAKTPYINFDAKTGNLEIKGRSIPENSVEFYRPVIDWLHDYSKQASPETNVHINLEYLNTSSGVFIKLLKTIEAIEETGSKVTIYWYYDDEDMYEVGEDYESITKVNFEYIAVDN
jgi:hypothetical protein